MQVKLIGKERNTCVVVTVPMCTYALLNDRGERKYKREVKDFRGGLLAPKYAAVLRMICLKKSSPGVFMLQELELFLFSSPLLNYFLLKRLQQYWNGLTTPQFMGMVNPEQWLTSFHSAGESSSPEAAVCCLWPWMNAGVFPVGLFIYRFTALAKPDAGGVFSWDGYTFTFKMQSEPLLEVWGEKNCAFLVRGGTLLEIRAAHLDVELFHCTC